MSSFPTKKNTLGYTGIQTCTEGVGSESGGGGESFVGYFSPATAPVRRYSAAGDDGVVTTNVWDESGAPDNSLLEKMGQFRIRERFESETWEDKAAEKKDFGGGGGGDDHYLSYKQRRQQSNYKTAANYKKEKPYTGIWTCTENIGSESGGAISYSPPRTVRRYYASEQVTTKVWDESGAPDNSLLERMGKF
ncbi:hypothetical protein LINPERHAP1_LOCUS12070 [Linum perenne]